MANPYIQNNDGLQLTVFNPVYADATIKFTGALTYVLGLIMARLVCSAGTVTADGGNTGDGTVTDFSIAPGIDPPPRPGIWTVKILDVTRKLAKLTDATDDFETTFYYGNIGTTTPEIFTIGGLKFTITDGAGTAFVPDDLFYLPIVDEESKWVPWVEDAGDGSGKASGILPVEVISTGAGDLLRRMLIGGEVALEKLVVYAGGDVPEKALDQLRDFTILGVPAVRGDILDNQ